MQRPVTQDEFDRLLLWLSPDRDLAGERYETIRRGLINIFKFRGCVDVEDLADETINRVARRLGDIIGVYEGKPEPYFYGVAKKIYLEHVRSKPAPEPLPAPEQDDEMARRYECFERCMEELPESNRELILLYYQEEKGAKINARKELGRRLNLNANALRARAFRIRERLERCVRDCLAQKKSDPT
jgi:RNA polymerase sigma factor (sigma-70 family)